MSTEISRYADQAMFRAEPVDQSRGPQVYLLEMTSDPLGSIAALSAMYTGKVVRSKLDVTDAERAHHLNEMKRTKLTTPLESVRFHFMIEGCTRAFTHQLVRNRTSAFAQESMRFAVKEDMPVALPPSLSGTPLPLHMWSEDDTPDTQRGMPIRAWHDAYTMLTEKQKQRVLWEDCVSEIGQTYNLLVNSGMPAEDARGLAPTNVLTRINYVTDLRTLIDVLGVRLCTQAQFEWRIIANRIAIAIADGYKLDRRTVAAQAALQDALVAGEDAVALKARIGVIKQEYRDIASMFRPICYATGKCEFMSDADRACSIRSRVMDNHFIGRPSSEWSKDTEGIPAITPEEWMLDPSAAR